ncbi:unnamed protein product [Callosobruchus maculatus]|uniref:Cytochrome P450 n=1 Tax=Callosobruchus maculatus TaxID=64391 RepID=A0A653CJ66_CALMS|nr:unnamed protein product [Callosobruchus maculatus]
MIIILTALLWIAIAAYYFLANRYAFWIRKGIKQTDATWLLGDNKRMLMKQESFADLAKRLYDSHRADRYSGTYQMLTPVLLIRDTELIKQICVKDFEYFVDHRHFVSIESDPLWAKNLFFLQGKAWREMRPILSPSFTSSKMRSMFVLMSECSERFVKHFSKKNEEIVEVELKDIFTKFCTDVIATCAFGLEVDSLNEPNNKFYLTGKKAMNFQSISKVLKFIAYSFFPWIMDIFKISFIEEDVRQFFYDLVDETIRIREQNGIVRPDMIQLLMEARKGKAKKTETETSIDTGFATAQESNLLCGEAAHLAPPQITNQDIAAQAMLFFFGGFESVSSLMCFMFHELAENPDIQDRLRNEIRETQDSCNGKVTYEALLKMEYMDMVVSETLRKWPSGVIMDRECTKPYTIQSTGSEDRPVHLKEGDLIWFSVYGLHHDHKYFPHPQQFNPERFSQQMKKNIVPYTYLPFGLGPRNCVGSRFALLETKTITFYLLSEFEIVPTEKTQIPLKLLQSFSNPTAENGFWVGLKRLHG